MQLSKYCLARGRYEIAEEFHRVGTQWYEEHVIRTCEPEFRKQFREVLAAYKAFMPEFAVLITTRQKILEYLNAHSEGIDRNGLKKTVGHSGVTSFGVICNQLNRGGWLRQEKGAKNRLFPPSSPPASDKAFIKNEIPTPDDPKRRAETARPVAKLVVRSHDKRWWEFWNRS